MPDEVHQDRVEDASSRPATGGLKVQAHGGTTCSEAGSRESRDGQDVGQDTEKLGFGYGPEAGEVQGYSLRDPSSESV